LPSSVYLGEKANISCDLINLGNQTETVVIEFSYQKGLIGNLTVSLGPLESKEAVYIWDTTNVFAGNYTIIVNAQPIQDENNLQNNQATTTISINYEATYQTAQLFSVLLVITGLFAFGLLFMFVRRQKSADQHNLGITPKPI
jgi:ATP-dependent Zn protease